MLTRAQIFLEKSIDADILPNIESLGEGAVILDGNQIPKKKPSGTTSTVHNILSGREIAGIVIACLIVIVAVVITVFLSLG